ncbi:hypothetical protein MT1_4213 [Pseudomonas sp. MT-1]|nr:hypothetical protein MT1_4213 [Pseudomonas sp. MT-1]
MAFGEFVAEIELGVAVTATERCAMFDLKTGGLYRFEHPGFLDEIQAMREQAFSDRKAWKPLSFDDQHVMPLTLEQGSSDGPRRPCANNDDATFF